MQKKEKKKKKTGNLANYKQIKNHGHRYSLTIYDVMRGFTWQIKSGTLSNNRGILSNQLGRLICKVSKTRKRTELNLCALVRLAPELIFRLIGSTKIDNLGKSKENFP